ncbi:MAG TPA: GNAT family N-acetyltransferase [Marmoricola sp.]|nr:GNAT family N-acetyltransferase [Marmoricola sp.]
MHATARLERLTTRHARPLERFERVNRAFFAARIGDRGDEYFEHFDDLLATRVQEDRAGTSLYFVIVDAAGEVLGRVNISDVDRPEVTELGFRVAERAQGRGLATRGVVDALGIAAARGVRTVKARAAVANVGSRRVLERCGFVQTGRAEAPGDRSEPFIGYRVDLDRTAGRPRGGPAPAG